jgi:hypothetical protein
MFATNTARQEAASRPQLPGCEASSAMGGRTLGSSRVHATMLHKQASKLGVTSRNVGSPRYRKSPQIKACLLLTVALPHAATPAQRGVIRAVLSGLEDEMRKTRSKVRTVLPCPAGHLQEKAARRSAEVRLQHVQDGLLVSLCCCCNGALPVCIVRIQGSWQARHGVCLGAARWRRHGGGGMGGLQG